MFWNEQNNFLGKKHECIFSFLKVKYEREKKKWWTCNNLLLLQKPFRSSFIVIIIISLPWLHYYYILYYGTCTIDKYPILLWSSGYGKFSPKGALRLKSISLLNILCNSQVYLLQILCASTTSFNNGLHNTMSGWWGKRAKEWKKNFSFNLFHVLKKDSVMKKC